MTTVYHDANSSVMVTSVIFFYGYMLQLVVFCLPFCLCYEFSKIISSFEEDYIHRLPNGFEQAYASLCFLVSKV